MKLYVFRDNIATLNTMQQLKREWKEGERWGDGVRGSIWLFARFSNYSLLKKHLSPQESELNQCLNDLPRTASRTDTHHLLSILTCHTPSHLTKTPSHLTNPLPPLSTNSLPHYGAGPNPNACLLHPQAQNLFWLPFLNLEVGGVGWGPLWCRG